LSIIRNYTDMLRKIIVLGLSLFSISACNNTPAPEGFRATIPPTVVNVPVYTATATRTLTPTLTATPTLTNTPTPTFTNTLTPSPTRTFTPVPTLPLLTLTPPLSVGAPGAVGFLPAGFTTPEGWSCEDFPCEDDIEGFLQRIRVPNGYMVEHVGRFPGQPMQITYGRDGRLYATLLENGTRNGAVYVMDENGQAERYSDTLISPVGLAFQPGTDVLYVSGRVTLESGGGLWRILPDGSSEVVVNDLPCCFDIIGSQPNGLIFGPDSYLYMGIGSLTDHLEPPNPQRMRHAELHPLEAAILRIHPHTGEIEVFAQGLRDPYDIAFDSSGQFYATDNGVLEGPGDRLLKINQGKHYGWPYWRERGCMECPLRDYSIEVQEDLFTFAPYSLPRGLTVYTGTQFPANMFDDLFVVLWNGIDQGQRVVHIDPKTIPAHPDQRAQYIPAPFVTGLIRPIDVVVAPDGSLVVADFIYGHVWRVRYNGETGATPSPVALFITSTPRP
jgi:hypothetical protein